MSCFGCFPWHEKKQRSSDNGKGKRRWWQSQSSAPSGQNTLRQPGTCPAPLSSKDTGKGSRGNYDKVQTFTYRELATATKNFRQECLIGEGGFGRVYRGKLEQTDKVVAVKQLDRNGLQGNREFLVEVLMLSFLHHKNLVNLVGYCADGDQRLLVYEYMPQQSLEDHLFDLPPSQKPLEWFTRMKIAWGVAKGLEYLHDKANPPVIYRDLKSANILLDEEFNAKISDFGLAKLGPTGNRTHVLSRVMGTYGYCAPEYQRTGQLTTKSDVYSFGVVLLELITGRRVFDTARPIQERNLITWAEPVFRHPKRFGELADPLMGGNYPVHCLNQVTAIAAMCLDEEPSIRPPISDIVTALSFLSSGDGENDQESIHAQPPPKGTRIIDILGDYFLEDGTGYHNEVAAGQEKVVTEATDWGSCSSLVPLIGYPLK